MATTNITIGSGGGNSIKSIQRGVASISISAGTAFYNADTTISSVNMSKSVVNVAGTAFDNTSSANTLGYATLTTSTNVRCESGNSAGSVGTNKVSFEVIEFN